MISTEHLSNSGKNKVAKKPHDMVIFWIQLRRNYWGISSQANPTRDNWTWSIFKFRLVVITQAWGDSSVLHCATLLCTIFTSLAHANQGMHVHNKINFPQAKLDSKINVPFLSNMQGDLYFLSRNNSVHIILFNLKKKLIFYLIEKRYKCRWRLAKNIGTQGVQELFFCE